MREILFRGMRVDNGKWIYGDLLQDKDLEEYLIEYFDYYTDENGLQRDDCQYLIIPETVGQYTGLSDKNGNKIFEGDIVAGAVYWLERQKNGIVAFRDGSFGLIWHRGDVEQFNPFTSMCNIEYEVIGNIHDNPELLKGGGSDA